MKIGSVLKPTSEVNTLHITPGNVGLYHISDTGRVAIAPYCVQPSGMDRAWMHRQAGYWLAADHNRVVVDGVFPATTRKPAPSTPYEGSWAHTTALETEGRGNGRSK